MYLLAKIRHGIKQPHAVAASLETNLATGDELRQAYPEVKQETKPKSEVITTVGELIGYQSKTRTKNKKCRKLKQKLITVKRMLAHKLTKMSANDLDLLFQITMKKYPKQMPSTEYHLTTEQTRHFFYLELFQHHPAIIRLIKLFHILHIVKMLARTSHGSNQHIKLEGFLVKEIRSKITQVPPNERSIQNKTK